MEQAVENSVCSIDGFVEHQKSYLKLGNLRMHLRKKKFVLLLVAVKLSYFK